MKHQISPAVWHTAASLLACLVLGVGCETLQSTSLDENSAAYHEARQFFQVGKTTREETERRYGRPQTVAPTAEGGQYWVYRRRETVLVDAPGGAGFGDPTVMRRPPGGYTHSVDRTTSIELFFDAAGVLAHYRINRGAM